MCAECTPSSHLCCRRAGAPVAWKLVPGGNPPMYAHPSSEHPRRAAFATKNLWVTPHSDDERFPAGDYCLRVGDNSGLLAWTALVRAEHKVPLVA